MRWSILIVGLIACGSPHDSGDDGGGGGVCGDGAVRFGWEACDGSDLDGQSCLSLGFTSGELGCRSDCAFDTTGCSGEADASDLDGATGCEGVFNPDQVLTYHVEGNVTTDGPGRLRCGDGPTLDVEVEAKRGGGFKIDFNQFNDAQSYFGLNKLVFDNSGSSELTDIVSQFLSWRMMNASGAVSSRAAIAQVYVNGSFAGLLVVIEAVDKRMLRSRFGDDEGWLYKKSGGLGDGLKTHETDGLAEANPYDDYLCFWESGNGCPVPSDVATALPTHLHLDQFLRMGAVNALISNTDSPIFKDNNYYYYDWPGKRYYLPWDLDTVMKDLPYEMVQSGSYAAVLLQHWDGEYRVIVRDLVAGPLTLAMIHGELDRVQSVAGPAIGSAGGDAAAIVGGLKTWWTQRHGTVSAQF